MENQSGAKQSGGFLSDLRGIFTSKSAARTTTDVASEFGALRDEFNSALSALQQRAAAQRANVGRRTSQHGTHSEGADVISESRRAQLKEEFEDAKRIIAQQVAELHHSLKTGVDPSSLTALRDFLLSIAQQMRHDRSGGIEERLRASAITAVFQSAVDAAWQKLNRRMIAAGVRWPEPHELSDRATPEQLALASERAQAEARDVFVNSTPESLAELITGVVPAWQISYPPQDSWLWKQVSLRAVAAGIVAHLMQQAVAAVRPQGQAIRDQVTHLLKKELDALNAAIGTTAISIEETDCVVQAAGDAVEAHVSGMVLDITEPIFARCLAE